VHLAESQAEADEILAQLPTGSSGLIDAPSSLAMYAATLFSSLRACDDKGWLHAVAVLPADVGLGRAIRDRLQRAASPS